MAQVSSGSFNTNSVEGRYLTFKWGVERTDIAGNYKEISWSLIGAGVSGYVTCGNFKITISGNVVYNSATRINVYVGTIIASGTYKMTMSNEGTKTFKATAEAGIYEVAVNSTGEGTWELPTINRYAKITNFVVEKVDETSVKFNWTADTTCDYAWYSTNNGSTWSGLANSNIVSGLSANTSYNFKLRVRRKDSQLTTDSGTYKQTTYDYPHCNSTPDFIIGNKVNIGLYNPLGRNCTVTMLGADGSTIYNGNGWTGTSIGDFATDTIVQNLYKSIPSSQNGIYRITVTYGSSSRGITGGTYKIRGTEKPTINGFDYIDSNENTVAITGNNQHIIQNHSTLAVRFHKATAHNYASGISQYKIECNGIVKTGNLEGSYDLGIINSSTNVDLKLTATDSRGLSSSKTIKVTMLPYTTPNALVDLKRKNNYEDETYLTVDGAVASLNSKNKMTIQYRYAVVGGSYNSFTTISDNTKQTLSLPKANIYNFNVVITDSLGGKFDKIFVLNKGVFPFFIDMVKNSAGLNKLPINKDSLEVAGDIYADNLHCKNKLYTPYTEKNKLTVTATRDDYSIVTGYYAYLEKGKQYTISCKTDAIFGGSNGTDTVEIFLLKDKAYTTYIGINTNPKTITISESGNYFLRYDINQNGKTHSLWDFQIEEGAVATDFVEAKEFNNDDKYFYEEHKVGTWFNGKPIYRRIVSLNGGHFGTEVITTGGKNININHNIANIEDVIKFEDIWKTNGQFRRLTSNYYANGGWDGHYYITPTQLCFELGFSIYSRIVSATDFLYIVVYYTKTTD